MVRHTGSLRCSLQYSAQNGAIARYCHDPSTGVADDSERSVRDADTATWYGMGEIEVETERNDMGERDKNAMPPGQSIQLCERVAYGVTREATADDANARL